MVKVTFLLVKEFLMMLRCHDLPFKEASKYSPFLWISASNCMLCFCNKGKMQGQVPSVSAPSICSKKITAFINTTLVLTGWSLLTLMSLKSYLQRTSVKAEVRYASALNPLALNPAKLSLLFLNQGRKLK